MCSAPGGIGYIPPWTNYPYVYPPTHFSGQSTQPPHYGHGSQSSAQSMCVQML